MAKNIDQRLSSFKDQAAKSMDGGDDIHGIERVCRKKEKYIYMPKTERRTLPYENNNMISHQYYRLSTLQYIPIKWIKNSIRSNKNAKYSLCNLYHLPISRVTASGPKLSYK